MTAIVIRGNPWRLAFLLYRDFAAAEMANVREWIALHGGIFQRGGMSEPANLHDTQLPPSAKILVAIGDIHGRLDLLDRLLPKISEHLDGRAARLVFLGDYIDRGPDSAGVLDRLIGVRESFSDCVFLKGNHEEALLDFLAAPEEMASWLGWGGDATLLSYGLDTDEFEDIKALRDAFAAALPDDHFRFLLDLELFHRAAPYQFVHAGLNPDLPFDRQIERDLLWIRDRFFNANPKSFGDWVIVHGHTPVDAPDNLSWRINVDTGAVWSSQLTAVVLDGEDRRFLTS
ncbi:hypothetical protein PB2503_07769 [Parvularcula bermudensis HTCC2503]|uniref:Calcineurin-like phosphoesterase domain-containing protein n=2 Tax=Parvularcula TaxID=208215 RepID=E0TGJ0_PARBH|nr:hypothetical protein PB2503_07769 [Parvularcula bermudensis HTCC2503]